jgi:hypothetical protein
MHIAHSWSIPPTGFKLFVTFGGAPAIAMFYTPDLVHLKPIPLAILQYMLSTPRARPIEASTIKILLQGS